MKLREILFGVSHTFTPEKNHQENLGNVVLTGYRKLPTTPIQNPKSEPEPNQKSSSLKTSLQASLEEMQKRSYGDTAVSAAKRWGLIDELSSVSAVVTALGYDAPHSIDDIYLHRSCDREFLNLEESTINNNKNAAARISNGDRRDYNHHLSKTTPTAMKARDLPHGGVNFIVSTKNRIENGYHQENHIAICCSLREVFERGGKVHSDIGAAVGNAVIVEMPQNVALPFKLTS